MRPVRLTMQGFKSHETRTEFDFSDRTLFAIVGPTGAGKTTILDGISYALYAKTPKIQRSTKSLICSTKDSAEIELVFEADDRTFTLNRSIRKTGAAIHVLTDDAGEKTTGESAVTEAVEELLGLDFSAFRSSVLLAQNQFDEFFRATPDTRMKILKGVFRFDQLDQMREAAKTHRNEHEMIAREIEGRLGEIPDDAAEQIETAKAELTTIDTRIAALQKVGPAEQKLTARVDRADDELAAATTVLDELAGLSDDMPDPKVMANLVAVEEQIAAPLEKAEKLVAELKTDHRKARAAVTELETKLGREATLMALQEKAVRLGDLASELEAATAAMAIAKTTLDKTDRDATRAATAQEKATVAVDKLEDERRALHTAHAAHGLRVGLQAGDPCPVCEQAIERVPKGKAPIAFNTIDERVMKAKDALGEAAAAARVASDQLIAARHSLDTAAKAAAHLEAQMEKVEGEVAGVLGKMKDPVREIQTRLGKLAGARETFERLDNDLVEAQDDLEAHKNQANEFNDARDHIYDELVHIASALKQPRIDRKATAEELSKAAGSLLEHLEKKVVEASTKVTEAASIKKTIETEMALLHADAGLEPEQTVAEALAQKTEARGRLGATITKFAKDIDRSIELTKELKKVKARIDVYATLYADLANTRFIDFLLEDKRRLLSELASAQLREMTGRYRFDDAGTFQVIDEFNADAERNVDSLSGGETFLASLSLALGLAESVTRHGGRLQCFFLDEGFGSLDPDSLQKALDGIERIATQDRLIGLVSHVQGVSERIVDKIELDRDDDGMTIVKEPAGPNLRVVG